MPHHRNQKVIECLKRNDWSRTAAAEELGVSYKTIIDHVRRARRTRHIPDNPEAAMTSETSLVPVSVEKIREIEERFGARWAIQVAAGNWSVARRITDEAEADANMPPAAGQLADCDISELKMPARLENALIEYGCYQLADLAGFDVVSFMGTPNIGPAAVDLLIKKLLAFAISREQQREK